MEYLLELQDVTKIYDGGVLANHNINFKVAEGEIHALVGENGAGKSTLMKMLYGLESLTSGRILLRGEELKLSSSADAIAHRIGMVHQHFMLVDSLTGYENLMLGVKKRKFICRKKEDIAVMNEIAEKYNFDITPERRVRDMSVGMKQKLEILKILYRGADIIILDEPTAVLTPQETEELFERLVELRNDGMTIIFISHKLGEVKQISDRITVLKSGEVTGTYDTAAISEEEISSLMVGRTISFRYDQKEMVPDRKILDVSGLNYVDQFGVPKLQDVSFEIYNKEIVGIAGVEGNGQSELVNIITGNLRADRGEIRLNEEDISAETIGNIRKRGISFVPEDRFFNGCAPPMNIQENLIVSNIDSFAGKTRLLQKKRIKSHSRKLIRDFQIRAESENQRIGSLSGGNIQKVIVAREFCAESDLLILDQPTRGIDVGAISFIHHKILEMRAAGKGILLTSADLTELIALSDRILVMHKGRIVASLNNRPKVTDTELGLYMLGIQEQGAQEDE